MGTLAAAYSRLHVVADDEPIAAVAVASPVTNARASAVRVARRRDADMIDRSVAVCGAFDLFRRCSIV